MKSTIKRVVRLFVLVPAFLAGGVACFAADAAGGVGATQQVVAATSPDAQQLVKQLSSHDAHTVMEAAYLLARLGDRSVVRDLVALLRSDSGLTREYALIALGGGFGIRIPLRPSDSNWMTP